MSEDKPEIFIKGLRSPRVRPRPPRPEARSDAAARPRHVQEILDAREAARAKELADALDSPYHWWWLFVKESEEVAAARGRKPTDPAVAKLARDFGNLDVPFDEWWFRKGHDLFAETRPIPKVRVLLRGEMNRSRDGEQLALEIPLTIRRATVLRQINSILKEHYKPDGAPDRLNVFAHSSANYVVNRSSKMRTRTFDQFYRVWTRRKAFPEEEWWVTGEETGVSPANRSQAWMKPEYLAERRRAMTLDVQRIYRKAKRLIYWAARGKFPCVDKCPSEGQQRKG